MGTDETDAELERRDAGSPRWTQLFYCWDGSVLARIRNSGAAVPEVFDERRREWANYPDLDDLTDARPITVSDALRLIPGLTQDELELPPAQERQMRQQAIEGAVEDGDVT